MSVNGNGERLIFVGGVARSGTTMLQNMLDSHPDILGVPEFGNISDIIQLRKKLNESITHGNTDVFCSCNNVDNHIRALIENLLLPLANKNKCKFLSEKTPRNILVFHELIELYPGAHFIQIVRDPRAVVCSIINVLARFREKGKETVNGSGSFLDFIGIIDEVMDFLNAGFSASKCNPGKVLTVIYERLVRDPVKETKRICNFIGIPWSEKMCYPSKKKHLGENFMTKQETWYNKKNFNRDPEIDEINKWKNNITPLQEALIAACFKDVEELKHSGYDFSLQGVFKKIYYHIFLFVKMRLGDKWKKRIYSRLLKNHKHPHRPK